jgi:hypothetical protein
MASNNERALPEVIEVIINVHYGALKISQAAVDLYNQRSKVPFEKSEFNPKFGFFAEKYRTDPILVAVIKELGKAACAGYSKFEIYQGLKDGYGFNEYDGLESGFYPGGYNVNIRDIVFDESRSDSEKMKAIREEYAYEARVDALVDSLRMTYETHPDMSRQ